MSSFLRSWRQTTVFFLILIGSIALQFMSCVEPSPFYGTWSDNQGNNFSFFADNTFSASFSSAGRTEICEGNYSILRNVLTLSCTNVELRVVTEWDIRGNILYLDWINVDGKSEHLSLYKISN